MEIIFVRHGSTESNAVQKYLGRSDEPLCETGIAQAKARHDAGLPPVDRVFVSPMLRCRQTAEIVFPSQAATVIDDFIEIDFGRFEGRTHDELMAKDRAYRAWLASGGSGEIPGGETRAQLTERSNGAFAQMLTLCGGCSRVAAVVHSGTIMGVVSSFMLPQRKFYDCYIGNCETLTFDWDGKNLLPVEISALKK